MARKLKPVSPGEMLAEEFLKPLGMSNYPVSYTHLDVYKRQSPYAFSV